MRDVVRFLCISFLSFTFISCILVLWPFDIHCTYIWVYIYFDVCYSLIFTCVVSFLSLCTWFFYSVCNLLFLFHTKMPWWVLFEVFQKYRLSKSSMPWTLFLQSFSRVCVRIDFIVFNKWIWVEWFMTSLIYSFVCCGFVMDC